MSKELLNASLTPAATIGYGTDTPMNMNMFNSFTGSGVNVPFEYAFSLGNTFVLSSGKTSATVDSKANRIPDRYNSHDTGNRHQRLGGTSVKVGNFLISSYNDVKRAPLFFGMNSDQFWSAGVNMQGQIAGIINMAYAFDLYYGKSNNKNPYNQDKIINGQNYDYQGLFDVLLNRGQETFSFTDAMGNFNKTTKFGYGTFWPSNLMHDNISFPESHYKILEVKKIKPERTNFESNEQYLKALKEYEIVSTSYTWRKIKHPPEPPVESAYKDKLKLDNAQAEYKKALAKYKSEEIDYEISMRIKPNATFHHLYLVYDGSNKINLQRLLQYMDADIPAKAKLLQEFQLLEEKFKNKE